MFSYMKTFNKCNSDGKTVTYTENDSSNLFSHLDYDRLMCKSVNARAYLSVRRCIANVREHRRAQRCENERGGQEKVGGERETCVQARFYGRVFAFPAQYI